jgi:hypothetical protein
MVEWAQLQLPGQITLEVISMQSGLDTQHGS